MNVSRRRFLSGAAAAGLASDTGTAGGTQTDIFDTPTCARTPKRHAVSGVRQDRRKRLHPRHRRFPEEADGVRLIRTAIDAGASFMDNAWEYVDGESERRMGRALRDGYHQKQHGFQ